jgi:hypothetical protein
MSIYIPIKVHISDGQHENIKRVLQHKTGVNVKLSYAEICNGDHVIGVAEAQKIGMIRACEKGVAMTLKLSKTLVINNTKIEERFLQFSLPSAMTAGRGIATNVLPALATGVSTGVGSAAVSKVVYKIAGRGVHSEAKHDCLYIKEGNKCCKIVPQGEGLYLRPYPVANIQNIGSGLCMKNVDGFVAGSELLTGDSWICRLISKLPFVGPDIAAVI